MRSLVTSLVVLLTLAAASASASTVRYLTDAELIARSDRVVHGRVVAQRTVRDTRAPDAIHTVTTLEVIEDLTGMPGDVVEVWQLGGRIGDESMHVSGAIELQLGAEVVMCLRQGRRGLRAIGMGLSTFDVEPTPAGDRRMARHLRDTLIVGGPATPPSRSLDSFRELTRQVTGRSPRAGRAAAALEQPSSVPEAFTTRGARWREADAGAPIRYYVSSSAVSPIFPTSPTGAVQTALAAWTGPAAASIVLQYAGTTAQPTSSGPWNGTIPANSVVVTFEDPNDEIDDPVLAITFSFTVDNGGGTVQGTTFDGYRRAAVIFQNAADLSPSFRQPLNFTRVLTHEIGHTIGLGHTQTNGVVINPSANIMYPTCCGTATPAPPALGPDDVSGLVYLYPTGGACTYAIAPSSASFPATGGVGSVTITTYNACAWTVLNSAPFVTLFSATSGFGAATIPYSIAPSGGPQRSATIVVGGQAHTITQAASLPSIALDRTALSFEAVTAGSTFTSQTSEQAVRLTQTGAGAVTWTTTPTQPWLEVRPQAGSGSATLTVSVRATGTLPSSGTLVGSVIVSYSGASTTTGIIAVTLALRPRGTSARPFGVVDTPLDARTGVTGAVPFTGWALDDGEVAAVSLCRAAVAGEGAALDARCGGAAQIYIGDGVFVEGARPDVQALYGAYPRSSRAGWGLLVLTNVLPNRGNGTYTFFSYAHDRDGQVSLLGTRTITCSNASATLPFGTIDTPGQGEVVSGNAYVNFGWALTQNPKAIPVDGSTLRVYIDGVAVGRPTYNNYRADIATLFPGLANSGGAIGYWLLDTTALSNGLHTISWTAADSGGFTEGLGSRFFTVANSATAATSEESDVSVHAARAQSDGGAGVVASEGSVGRPELAPDAVAALPMSQAPVSVRRGWDADAAWQVHVPSSSGRAVIRAEEIDRLELHVPPADGGSVEGHLRVGDQLSALPVGSRLEPATGTFLWSPGVGFVGRYDLVFVRWAGGRAISRQEVRFILQPKGHGHVGPQVVIDTPAARQDVGQPFLLAGWAADLDASQGTGIDTLHAWAYPRTGGAPVFLGAATMAGVRPDVAAVHGDQFRDAGYGVMVQGLTPGTYDLAVFAWSRVTGGFVPATIVRVTVR